MAQKMKGLVEAKVNGTAVEVYVLGYGGLCR